MRTLKEIQNELNNKFNYYLSGKNIVIIKKIAKLEYQLQKKNGQAQENSLIVNLQNLYKDLRSLNGITLSDYNEYNKKWFEFC